MKLRNFALAALAVGLMGTGTASAEPVKIRMSWVA